MKPKIMGILNVTPDSFSDGGNFFLIKDAIAHGQYLKSCGADIIDIGGQSTAPGRQEIGIEEECARVLPVIEGLKALGICDLSIDTSKSLVAKKALNLGVAFVNDQTAGLGDPDMPNVFKDAKKIVLMHNKGLSGVDAGEKIIYADIIDEINSFFKTRLNNLISLGIKKEQLIVDPGIGFGKGLKDSLKIISQLSSFKHLGVEVMIGLSRKSFIGKLVDEEMPNKRDDATLILEYISVLNGVNIIRTHNVKQANRMVKIYENLH